MQVSESGRARRIRANLDQSCPVARNGASQIRLRFHPRPERMMTDLILRLAAYAFLLGVFLFAYFINF